MSEVMSKITVAVKDGESALMEAGVSVKEALGSLLSNKQRKQTVAARIDDTLVDFTTVLEHDTTLEPVQIGSQDALDVLRHST
ncbi:MAG: threonine--tRNA ligase, partial [Desulfobacterales bacterium]